MKLAPFVLVALFAGGAVATTSWAPLPDTENSATMQHVPRAASAPCGPLHLRVVVTTARDADVVSGLLWQAGMPPGSTVDFAWPDGDGIRAPAQADLAWARALVAAC